MHFIFIHTRKNHSSVLDPQAFIHEDSHLYMNHFAVIYKPFASIKL